MKYAEFRQRRARAKDASDARASFTTGCSVVMRLLLAIAAILSVITTAPAQTTSRPVLSKADRIFLRQGLQIHALGFEDAPFNLKMLQAANFTGVNWNWKPNPAAMGQPPGKVFWNYWVGSESETSLKDDLKPYERKLIALQLRDEQNMNDPIVRAAAAKWFGAVRKRFPDTILYSNQYGGQVTNENMGKYWDACKPDMLSFDTYPMLEGPDNWRAFYGDAQRYRKLSLGWGVPCAMWIQTFHGENRYRDPSESEMRLNQFAAWTFGYKMVTAFTYNAGSTNLFKADGARAGDQNPAAAYHQIKQINRESLHLGPALVRLTSTDVRFIAGQHLAGDKPVDNPLPIDIQPWRYNENDPFIRGITVQNVGTMNHKLRGDVIIGWFKPSETTGSETEAKHEIYFMITNGLCDRTADSVQSRQRIIVNLHFGGTAVKSVQRLNRITGKVQNVALRSVGERGRYLMTIELDGGAGDLFKFDTGSAFVGAQAAASQSIHR